LLTAPSTDAAICAFGGMLINSRIMKGFRFFIVSLIFVLSFSAVTFAQTAGKSAFIKVAVINTERFFDDKTGIKRLVWAERVMGSLDPVEAFRHVDLLREAENLEKEIATLKCQNQNVDDKVSKLQKLKDEIKQTKDAVDAFRERQEAIIYTPVMDQIREKIKVFAKDKGYEIIIEKTTVIESFVNIEGEIDDVTLEFIKFCNDAFDQEKSQ
jgi:Skp family chaperone for outer membrane proteins